VTKTHGFFAELHRQRSQRLPVPLFESGLTRSCWTRRDRGEHLVRLPRPLEGHRDGLQVRDAGDGGLGIIILVRVLTLGRPRPAPPANVNERPRLPVEPELREARGTSRRGSRPPGQIFFSLSVGFGVIINYASYMKKKDDVVLSGLTSSATNEFFEVVLGGLITVTASSS
jgi:hypothetical protein